jgi:hypothetical protein
MTQTAQRLLAEIRKLVPHTTSRAAEIEARRRIPLESAKQLANQIFLAFVAGRQHNKIGARGAASHGRSKIRSGLRSAYAFQGLFPIIGNDRSGLLVVADRIFRA